jgi:hypothetical protein
VATIWVAEKELTVRELPLNTTAGLTDPNEVPPMVMTDVV